MQRRRQPHRCAVEVVGRDDDEVRLGHRRDFLQLQDAPHVAHIRVDDIRGLFLEYLPELELRVKLLAGNYWNPDVPLRRGKRVHVFRQHRLLVPEGAVLLYLPRNAHRVHRGQPPVHLHQYVHVGADGLPYRRHILDGLFFHIPADEGAPRAGDGVELHRVETHLYDLGSPLCQSLGGLGPIGPAVGVDPYLVPASAPQQSVHRSSQGLAGYVPHGLLQTADGAPEVHRAPAARKIIVGYLGKVLDVHRVPPDQVTLQLVHVGRHLQVAVRLRIAFSPAVDTLVGINLDEAKVFASARMREEGIDSRNLHSPSPCDHQLVVSIPDTMPAIHHRATARRQPARR